MLYRIQSKISRKFGVGILKGTTTETIQDKIIIDNELTATVLYNRLARNAHFLIQGKGDDHSIKVSLFIPKIDSDGEITAEAEKVIESYELPAAYIKS